MEIDKRAIVDKFGVMVSAMAHRMIRNKNVAEEAAQEVWVEILKGLDSFQGKSELSTLAEHSHAAQWSIVLNGKIELTINGEKHTFVKGDTYCIPRDVKHYGLIYPGYTDITFFDQPDRYEVKERSNDLLFHG